ncbi:uncharacterized protein LOC122395265 [Colletes gigas]|uniref:uncharacterized protein LOC122395265 n=1 Tax=Colletes gigas TaxID=935657 RepID=UPI001C9B04AA|nr:uncharacterized protein LOC122395265 [Colletes gigas]
MKFCLVTLTALVAFATVNCHYLPTFGEGPLYEDIQYFMDMIPMKDVMAVTVEYAALDTEFQELLGYFETDEFHQLLEEVENIPEFRVFANYLQTNGVYIYNVLNKLNQRVGIPPFQPILMATKKITGGLKGYFEDVKSYVDYDLFIHGYVYKMRNSEAFRHFVAHLKSPNHQKFIDTLYQNELYLNFRHSITNKGLDVALVEDIIFTVLGIEFPDLSSTVTMYDSELSKDIKDFVALIDKEKIVKIVLSYLDDDEVQKAMTYMYGEDFHELTRTVEGLKEYQDLVLYLHDAGLNIFGFLQKVHNLFGMEDYVPPKVGNFAFFQNVFVNRGGVKKMVDDVIDALPLDKFKQLYQVKMKNSPAFRDLIMKLRSEDLKEIVATIYKSPVFLEMRQKAIDAGLDLEPVRVFFKKVFDFEFPKVPDFSKTMTMYDTELSKDIKDFVALIDKEKIVKIVLSYLDDDEVQKAMTYMYGEDFHELTRTVEGLKEYQDLVLYLHDAGLNIFGFLQKVHNLFGMEDYVPPKVGNFAFFENVFVNRGGVKKMVDDVIDALPLDKFKQLYQVKMKNSPAFRDLIMKLRSEDLKEIVATIYKSPVFLEMRQKAIDAGLDLEPVRVFFKKVFDFEFPKVPDFSKTMTMYDTELSKDIKDFVALIDKEKIVKIVLSYLDDDEVQKAMTYMYGEDFHELTRTVEGLKEYQDLVLYLHDAGLNIFGFLQKVHNLFGMEDYVPPKVGNFAFFQNVFVNRGGVKKMVDDVIDALPLDKFKQLYQVKMKNSPAFRDLIMKLRSEDLKEIVATIYKSPVFLEMRQKAIDAGLDLEPVRVFFKKVFDFEFPQVPDFSKTMTMYDTELSKDIKDFVALIDKEKIVKIVLSYLDDDEVQKAMTYMYGEDFHELTRTVEGLKEYQDLVLYLHNAGLNIFGFLQKVHNLFGMEDYVPPKVGNFAFFQNVFVNRGGVKKMVDDVIDALPLDKFKQLYQVKMKNSPAFRDLIMKLRSEDLKEIVATIYKSPIFLEMRQKAIDAGLDLEPVRVFFKKVFDFEFPKVP